MLIGQLAQLTGASTKTLRFYEASRLLPNPVRTPSGYRDYDPSAVDRLAFIHRAQSAGLTLAQIREVIDIREQGVAPCEHVAALLDTKIETTTRQIAQLRALQKELRKLRERAATTRPATCDPRHVCDVLAGPR